VVDTPHDVLDIALVGHVARLIPVFVGEAEVVFCEEVSEGLKARGDAGAVEFHERSIGGVDLCSQDVSS
jgi:hypothetical protein